MERTRSVWNVEVKTVVKEAQLEHDLETVLVDNMVVVCHCSPEADPL